MRKTTIAWTRATALFVSGTALAHSGHGGTEPDSISHYLLEPLHVAAAATAVVAVVAFAAYRVRARRPVGPTKRST